MNVFSQIPGPLTWLFDLALTLALMIGLGAALWKQWRISRQIARLEHTESEALLKANEAQQRVSEAERRLAESERRVKVAERRLEAVVQVSQKFVEASSEGEVVELVMRMAMELTGTNGASFVPVDEHGQPGAAASRGQLPFPAVEAWVEYLATPVVRRRCNACGNFGSLTTNSSCPLLSGPFSDGFGMFCLPMRRGEREYGVLSLFIPAVERLDLPTYAALRSLVDGAAMALESVRLRRQELEALRQLNALRQKSEPRALLCESLENIRHTLEADYAVLKLVNSLPGQPGLNLPAMVDMICGEIKDPAQPLIEGLLQGSIRSGEPMLLGEVSNGDGSPSEVRSVLVAPLLSNQAGGPEISTQAVGALLLASVRSGVFHPRHLELLQVVAGQVALLLQNSELLARLEYRVVMQERLRLAREIHDGLAQTIGFLKLQTAQMKNYLAHHELDRLEYTLAQSYGALAAAYQDARTAIDGLRVIAGENGLAGWLAEVVTEFHEISGLQVEMKVGPGLEGMPPEVQAQLVRIVQEALHNVRKHSGAEAVTIAGGKSGGDFWLEIQDNGCGFAPGDIPGSSRHGLRGMRERAELIGADFQVTSQPGQGAAIRLRLPLDSRPPLPASGESNL